jgi:phosphoribosylformylglycinamidine cyclo-ligase
VEAGGIDFEEAHRAFNMGVGMVVVVDESDATELLGELNACGERAWLIGEVQDGEGRLRWA